VPPLWAAYHLEAARQGRPNATADVPFYNEIDTTVQWFNAGNPIRAVYKVAEAFGRGRTVGPVLGEVLENYAIFHGIVTAAFVGLALVRLRPVALAQAGAPANRKKRRFGLQLRRRRPPVGPRPMLWKEVRVEGGLRFGWFGRILIALVVGISFVPFVFMVYEIFFDPKVGRGRIIDGWTQLREGTQVWVSVVNTIVSTLMLLGVAVRAAGSVGGERDRDTLTSLMTSTLTTGEIVWAKLVGSLMSVRLLLGWVGVVWIIGLVTGGVSMLCVPLQCIAWVCPALFVGSLGLYFSAACKTTLRAIPWTVFGALIALGGHWVCVGMGCYLPLSVMNMRERDFEWLLKLESGLTPPFLFAVVPVENPEQYFRHNNEDFVGWAVVAQFIWLVASMLMWHRAHMRFRRLTNRTEVRSPARRASPPAVLAAADDADES
jgi:ABC-type transport system involved in multi-copper enzyme maturation permease subunit